MKPSYGVAVLLFTFVALPKGLLAQTQPPTQEPRELEALRAQLQRIQANESELSQVTDQAARSALRSQLEAARDKLTSIATGFDVAQLDARPEPFDLRNEIESLLEPLVRQLKDATEAPREIERLKTRKETLERRRDLISAGAARLDALLAALGDTDQELRRSLSALKGEWEAKRNATLADLRVATFELENKIKARESVFESTGSLVKNFFQSRGFNLLVAVGAFFAVFLSLRFVQRRVVRLRRGERSFYRRLAGALFHIFVIIASVAAMILALFARDEWVLLVLVFIFLVGVGWASIRMLPQFFEQIRLLLNLGSVREDERVIFNGLPWRVAALRVYTTLVNPELTGGRLRLPITHLIGLYSRPVADNELWFPCHEGDWVILADDTRGKVIVQTPDMVELMLPGGGQKTYQTTAFLGLNPKNLSRAFRINATFGIDYAHQAISTTQVPAIMQRKIETGLLDVVTAEQVINVDVGFTGAGASSLDYSIVVDFEGSAASKYLAINRAIPRLLVDACNEHGWVIPFTQVTLHQAS